MKFSIIVVVSRGVENKDRSGVWQTCFKGLYGQDFPKENFEVVVVDSGSGLDSGKITGLTNIALSLGVGFTFINPGLGNIGPAQARNIGLKAVYSGQTKLKATAVAFTDDDTLVPKDWLAKLSESFSSHPEAAGVGGLTLPAKGLSQRNIFASYDEFIYNRYPRALGPSRSIGEHPVFSGNLAYKLEVLEKVGGFDESYAPWVYGEDADLKERVVKAGGYLIFSPVVNTHLAAYNWQRFMRQQECRGAGILKFRQKHNLPVPSKSTILLRLAATPFSFFYYLPKTSGNLRLTVLEATAYFYRQVGKLKYLNEDPSGPLRPQSEARRTPLPAQAGQDDKKKGKKLKILFVDHTPLVGGAQLALLRHLQRINKDEFLPVVAVSPRCQNFTEKLSDIAGLRVYILDFPKLKPVGVSSVFKILAAALRLFIVCERENPKVVVANTERSFYAAFLVSLILGKKLVLAVRDFEYSHRLLAWTRFKVSKYICVSKKIKEFYGFSKKAEVIYVGSDLEERLSQISREQVEENRIRIKAGTHDTVIGFVGRVVSWKGIFLLFESFAQILSEEKRIKLVFVGGGPDKKDLVEAARQRGVLPYIYFEDFVDKVELWYKTFDIFVHASVAPEPFATTVIEAAFARLPIVATNTGGTSEFVIDGENGLLVEPNKDALAQALKKLIDDEKLRKRLGEAAHESASKNCTENKITEQFENVYRQI